jgi:hypothetical protein
MEKHPHTEALERMRDLLREEAAKFKAVAEENEDNDYLRVVWSTRHQITDEFLYLLDYFIDQSGTPLEDTVKHDQQ